MLWSQAEQVAFREPESPSEKKTAWGLSMGHHNPGVEVGASGRKSGKEGRASQAGMPSRPPLRAWDTGVVR